MIANLLKKWMSDNDTFVSSIIFLLLSRVFEMYDVLTRANRKSNCLPTLFSEFLKHSSDAFNVQMSDMDPKDKLAALSTILSAQDNTDISNLIIFLKKHLLLLIWNGWNVVGQCEKGDIDTGVTLAHIIVSNISAAILIKIKDGIRNFESTDYGAFYRFGPGYDMIALPPLGSLYQGKDMTPIHTYPKFVRDILTPFLPNRRSLQLNILLVIQDQFYQILTSQLAKESLLFDYDVDATIDENVTTESSHNSDEEEETKELTGSSSKIPAALKRIADKNITSTSQVKALVANVTVFSLHKMLEITLKGLPDNIIGLEELIRTNMSNVIFIDEEKANEESIPTSTIKSRQMKIDGRFQFPILSIYSLMSGLEDTVFNPLLGSVESFAYYKEELYDVVLSEINEGFDKLVLIITDLLNVNIENIPYTHIVAPQYAFKFFDFYVNSAMKGLEDFVDTILDNKFSPRDRLAFRLALLTKQSNP
jgi:hypothetical protein